ncbi:NAD(P)-dependent oxidoreductase [Prauserella rugosa]|uniref:3-hydroxyisobutyrate dehydrogenase n=1 Tax=Prauserella rugosa TaxID=43354 RepID=A0A660C4R1_9PSEU|nr:NAD(P)-dependent oxidoreductase [Prauserella rugosa]TWH18326.1 3-hydroxyisobutyrate dehydrogenase [Prauserella rugosa]
MKVGFVGVGNMGGAVARRLATGGHDVHVADPDPGAARRCVDAGAVEAVDATAAAAHADAVFTSLPSPEIVEQVWRSITPHLDDGTVGVDVSTIDPATADRLHDVLAGHGIRFVHCALGKTPAAAEAGEIPLFAGGTDAAVDTIRPLLDRMGERTYRFATPGKAATFKLISNLVGMTNVAVLAEGLTLALRAGIDPQQFVSALNDTGARSFQSEVRLPWMAEGDDAARFGVQLAAKDLRLVVDSAARAGVPTPLGGQTLAQLLAAMRHGWGDEDVVALRKLLAPPDE